MFESLNLTPYDLNVDTLDVHADKNIFHRCVWGVACRAASRLDASGAWWRSGGLDVHADENTFRRRAAA